MAAKKTVNKKVALKSGTGRRKRPRGDDPPIIVGGGSSTYIWIRNTYSLVCEPNPDPQYPIDLNKYDCYDVNVDLGSYQTHDGVNPGGSHSIKNRRLHNTKFFKAQTKRK